MWKGNLVAVLVNITCICKFSFKIFSKNHLSSLCL